MALGLRSKLIIVFGFMMLISIGNFGILWVVENNAEEKQAWVLHTHEVILKSESLLGNLRDAETGQRGYLLTGQTSYLEPYDAGSQKARSDFAALRALTVDNVEQQARLDVIQNLMTRKLDELAKTVQLTKSGNRDAAMAIVNSDMGNEAMAAIRDRIWAFETAEQSLLKTREANLKIEQDRLRLLLGGESLLLIALICFVTLLVQRGLVTPVIALTRNTKKLAAGEEFEDIKAASQDEMGQLTQSFNEMAHAIQDTLERLAVAQSETEDKERRLSEIIWSASIGTWEWNVQTDDIHFNERWAEIIGCTLAELEPVNADTWRRVCHPDDMVRSREQLERHFSGEQDFYQCEMRRRHKDGSWIWVLDRGRVVEWASDGTPLRMSGTNMDISERKEAEKVKAEFTSTVSHELRTPLTSIKGALGLIQAGAAGDLPDELKNMLEIAYNNSDRLVLLINDILDVEKMEAGRMEFHMRSLEVQALVSEALESNKGYADQHDVAFVRSGVDEALHVEGDKDRLLQVLANLLSNAAKFSPAGATVGVGISHVDGAVRISVSDEGPGIPDDFAGKIFEKFTQVDSSDTRKIGGTGLGLSITKAIVDHHRGTIWFESDGATGTTFHVDLPDRPERRKPEPLPRNENGQYTILICEDEADIANLLEMMLRSAGYQTDIAGTASEAKHMLEDGHFDAMTLDLALPDQDGASLLQELRSNEATRSLPVIVVSATADDCKRELNGDAIGVVDWINKPIDADRLVSRLGEAVTHGFGDQPRILHIEDDESVIQVVSALIAETGQLVAARTIKEARALLEQETFDLVILDLILPDGNGETLLPLLNQQGQRSVPVVVFSAGDGLREAANSIRATLVKSRTSNDQLLSTIRSIIGAPNDEKQAHNQHPPA